MEISVEWDGRAIRQAFGACNIVADGVATLADGRRFRVNASANRAGRKPEVILRYMTKAKRGAIVPESALAEVRAAALSSFAEFIAPLRAEFLAPLRAALIAATLQHPSHFWASAAGCDESCRDCGAAWDADAAAKPCPATGNRKGAEPLLAPARVDPSHDMGGAYGNSCQRCGAGVATETAKRPCEPSAEFGAMAALVANTTRACYWRLADGSHWRLCAPRCAYVAERRKLRHHCQRREARKRRASARVRHRAER